VCEKKVESFIMILLFYATRKMIERYIDYIQYTKWYSFNTVTKYRKWLNKFECFLLERWKTTNRPEEIELTDALEFISHLMKSGLQPSSCNSNLDGVKGFLNYLREILQMDVLDPYRIKYVKEPQKSIWYYSEEQKRLIINTVDNWIWKKGITQLRNKLLTYMLLHTGLRCHEIAKIKVEEIWESLQVVGKGWKLRTVYLRPELLDMIGEYLDKRDNDSEYLFPSHNIDGGHIREWSIRNIYNKLTKKLWFHIHAHKFRHTFATDLLHLPWSNIYDVSKLMGHSRITTTQIYLGTNQESLKRLQFWLAF